MYLMMFIPKVGSCQVLAKQKQKNARTHLKNRHEMTRDFSGNQDLTLGMFIPPLEVGIGGDWSLGHSVNHFVFDIKVVGNNRYL
jgi:hypothetical protein